MIYACSKYPEVMVVQGTSTEDNIEAFTEVFSQHGVPKKIRSDNGPPFNGRNSHLISRYFKYLGIQHQTNFSAEDPESSGQVESFMKHLGKVFHTAEIEGRSPQAALAEHLMNLRARPHPSTKKSQTEASFR